MALYRYIFCVFLQCAALLACGPLPSYQTFGGTTFRLFSMTECKGGKVYEVRNVMDYDQCRNACIRFSCAAVNVFQLNEFDFMCEILENVEGMVYAPGASCYAPF